MTTDQEFERTVRSWLQPGLTTLTDDVLDAVLLELPATRQRRPLWSRGRTAGMSRLAPFAVAATAGVVVALVGLMLLGAPRPAEPGTTPAPSDGVPPPVPSGSIEPDRYRLARLSQNYLTIELGGGWTGSPLGMSRDEGTPGEISLLPSPPGSPRAFTHVYGDACGVPSLLDPFEPTVDGLVAALETQAGTDAVTSPVSTVWADGSRVELRQEAGLDRAECRSGRDGPLDILVNEAGERRLAIGPGSWAAVYVLEVVGQAGQPIVFAATFGPDATEADVTEVDAIVRSLELAPLSGSLPALRLPGTRASPAGEYGWEGGPGQSGGMHKVIAEGQGSRAIDLIFRVGERCPATIESQGTRHVRLARLEGILAEPFEPPVTFAGPLADATTRAYALAVADRTLCIFLTWRSTTTDEELAAAEQILETLRAEPIGDDRIRIVFTLDEGWDVG